MTALRIARTNRGRSKVALFSGSYHGHFDGVLGQDLGGICPEPVAPGIPAGMVQDLMILEYGSEEALRKIEQEADQLAAVLVEPVQSRHPDLQPAEFLKELRSITRRAGVILIFDEMITGFRIHPGGAQAWFGVEADIATYGKIVGGGMPIGVIAGRGNQLDAIDGGVWQYGDDSFPSAESTFFCWNLLPTPHVDGQPVARCWRRWSARGRSCNRISTQVRIGSFLI